MSVSVVNTGTVPTLHKVPNTFLLVTVKYTSAGMHGTGTGTFIFKTEPFLVHFFGRHFIKMSSATGKRSCKKGKRKNAFVDLRVPVHDSKKEKHLMFI